MPSYKQIPYMAMTSDWSTPAETFEHVRDHWKLDEFKTCKDDWKAIVSQYQQHCNSKSGTCANALTIECKGCSRKFCKHLSGMVCSSMPAYCSQICTFCDTRCQPLLCNPINREFCKKYLLPEQLAAIGIRVLPKRIVPPKNNVDSK